MAGSELTATERAEREDLVVDSGDRRLVLNWLTSPPAHLTHPPYPAVTPAEQEEDPQLELVLLRRLAGLDAAAAAIRTHLHDEIEALTAASGRPFTDLDVLLHGLRRDFAATFGGWIPTMGKNREVDGVQPLPGGGGGKVTVAGTVEGPTAAAPPDQPPGTQGSGVTVGILDTPLYPHRRLIGHVLDRDLVSALFTLVEQSDDGGLLTPHQPWEGHATFVADRVLAQAPGAQLDVRGVLRGLVGGATAWDTARELVRFGRSGIAVLNLSLGCLTADGKQPLVLSRAVQRLDPDILVVAAAGNHGTTNEKSAPIWPAALPAVIAVGATGADFSPNLPWVTCTARGKDVVGAFISGFVEVPAEHHDGLTELTPPPPTLEQFDGYAMWSGTSFAAAQVSGAVAAAMRPGQSAREAFEELLGSDDPDSVVKPFEFGP